MNQPTKNLPLALRLGLRDLASNKVATGVLVAIVALVIGAVAPSLTSAKLSAYDARTFYAQYTSPDYAPAEDGTNLAIQATTPGYLSLEETQGMVGDLGLRAIPKHLSSLTFADIPDPFVAAAIASNPSAADNYPDGAPGLMAETWTSAWADPDEQKLVRLDQGRLPQAEHEIAIDLSEPEPGQLNPLSPVQVGQTLRVERDGKQSEVTVVGTYQAAPYLPQVLSYSATPGVEDLAETGEEALPAPTIIVGPPLTDGQALGLAQKFSKRIPAQMWEWSIRNLAESPELAHKAALIVPFNDYEKTLGSRPEQMLALVGALTFIALLSVPLLWQNHRRRSTQTEALRRNGFTERSLWTTRLIPGLIVGLVAGGIGFALALTFIRVAPTRFGYFSDFGISTDNVWVYALLLCLTAGAVSMVVASIVPQLVDLLSGKRKAAPAEAALEPGPRRGFALPFALLLVGFGAMTVIALSQNPPMADWAMALWFIPVIAGAYVFVARLLPRVADRYSESKLALRLGARELGAHRSASINAIIAVALLTGLAATITVIGRQHDIEYQDSSRGYFETAIWIAVIIAVLVLLVLYYVTLRSTEELTLSRSGLLRQGVDDETLVAADSHKALLVAGLGGAVGYVLGTITGTLLMIYRDQGDNAYAFKPLAMLPDLTTLVAIVLPIVLAYAAGRLAGGQNRKVSLVAA